LDQGTIVFLLIIAAILLLFFLSGKNQEKKAAADYRRKLKEQFGKAPLSKCPEEQRAHLSGYFRKHPAENQIDGITWSDLELDRIYDRINYTQSAEGEEYLYWLLRTPAEGEDSLSLSEPQISAMQENEEYRIRLETELHRSAQRGKYSLYDYIDAIDEVKRRSVFSNLYAILLLALSVLLFFVSVPGAVVALFAVLSFNILTYYRERAGIDPYFESMKMIVRLSNSAGRVGSLKASGEDVFAEEKKEILGITHELSGLNRTSFLLSSGSSGNPADIFLDYLRILLHLDMIGFYSMLASISEHKAEIDRLITLMGKIDATISVSLFRASLPWWTAPVFLHPSRMDGTSGEKDAVLFEAADLYHPLLMNPVPNSIATDGYVLVTGSNASGKSTFLKASALCWLPARMQAENRRFSRLRLCVPCFPRQSALRPPGSTGDVSSASIRAWRCAMTCRKERAISLWKSALSSGFSTLQQGPGTRTVRFSASSTRYCAAPIPLSASQHPPRFSIASASAAYLHLQRHMISNSRHFSRRVMPIITLTRRLRTAISASITVCRKGRHLRGMLSGSFP